MNKRSVLEDDFRPGLRVRILFGPFEGRWGNIVEREIALSLGGQPSISSMLRENRGKKFVWAIIRFDGMPDADHPYIFETSQIEHAGT